jgi:hypothetical protein
MADPHRVAARRLPLLAALTLVAALGACETGSRSLKRESERGLVEIAAWLPGNYENSEQVRADAQAGRAARDPAVIAIVPIYAPSIGDHVYFAEEMAANDLQRVRSEQLLSFAVSDQGTIVETNYALKDPLRWRSAYQNPEMFEGLQAPDLKGIAGCPLLWKRVEDRFVATNDPHSCRAGTGSASKPAPSVVRAELSLTEFALGRRGDLAGADPLDRFRKIEP